MRHILVSNRRNPSESNKKRVNHAQLGRLVTARVLKDNVILLCRSSSVAWDWKTFKCLSLYNIYFKSGQDFTGTTIHFSNRKRNSAITSFVLMGWENVIFLEANYFNSFVSSSRFVPGFWKDCKNSRCSFSSIQWPLLPINVLLNKAVQMHSDGFNIQRLSPYHGWLLQNFLNR